MNDVTVVCPKCNGEGYLMNRGQQLALGILTLGFLPLIDAALGAGPRDSMLSRKCNVCSGKGRLR
jgi:DnaJ-class molecular chaperone